MLETIVHDVSTIMKATFMSGDYIALVIAFGSVVVASLLMRRGAQIGSMTLLALVIFAIGGYLRGYFRAPSAQGATQGDRAVAQLQASWASFMDMQAGTLLAYFLAFMVLILVLYGARAIFGGSGR
jgi:hypothetical protein